MDQNRQKLFEEIVHLLGGFYLAKGCTFIEDVTRNTWYHLPPSQVKRLQEVFEKDAKQKLDKRAKKLSAFISKQAEKEKRRGEKGCWSRLLLKKSLEAETYLANFLFRFDEKFLDELIQAIINLINYRSEQNRDCKALLPEVSKYLLESETDEADMKTWRRETLLPLVASKLFYTLITLHHLKKIETYKNKKEWLPCSHLTH